MMNDRTTCWDWLERLDVPDFITLFINIALQVVERSLVSLIPLYVPPNDSLSNFPQRPGETVSSAAVHTGVIVALVLSIAGIFVLHRVFPYWFRPINIFAGIWIWGCEASLITVMTDLFKNFVGHARPNFYAICGRNTQFDTCNPAVSQAALTNTFQSWPSGHTTNAMHGALFCALLWKKAVVSTVSWASTAALALTFVAFIVGATRIRDYVHHADDVLAGLLIASIICGLMWYRGHRRIFPKRPPAIGTARLGP
jgi:phosphatidate phosphatase